MSGELTFTVNESDGHSTTATPLLKRGVVPVIGYPGPMFAVIHLSALTVLSVSTVVSAGLMAYLCRCHRSCCRCCRSSKYPTGANNGESEKASRTVVPVRTEEVAAAGNDASNAGGPASVKRHRLGKAATQRNGNDDNNRHIGSFWRWNVGERLVLYHAVSDISFGISHIFDHAYMVHTGDHPPDLLCSAFAFLLQEFSLAQWFVVVISAVSACSLVVFGKKFSLGRWDWRLLVFAFLVPCVVGSFGIKYRLLGASGAWCYVNLATEAGMRYHRILTVCQVSLYGIVSLAYGAIWLKIKRTARLMKLPSGNRYKNSAVVMLVFVGAFVFQWLMFTLYNFWVLTGGDPPAAFFVVSVILVNMGGVYNCFAYTVVRRRIRTSGCSRVVVQTPAAVTPMPYGNTNITATATATATATTTATVTDSNDNGDIGCVSSSASNTSFSEKYLPFEIYI